VGELIIMKRVLLSVVAIASGLLVLLDFFVDSQIVDAVGAFLVEGAVVLGGFALLLGVINLLTVHGARAKNRERDWGLSLVLLITVLVVLLLGVAGPASEPVSWTYNHVLLPLQATLFALLAFFVATAAYRAYRVKSWESLLMVGAGVIVLLGQVPLGRMIWEELPLLKDWLMAVPAMAGARGILIGVALGSVIAGLRLLLVMDRPYL
jgi:hypothetical protein